MNEASIDADFDSRLLARLEHPVCPVDVVLDTDTANEVDDQYALAYLLRSDDRLCTQAIYAAPFFDRTRRFGNFASDSAEDGMEKSWREIHTILSLMERHDLGSRVFKGSPRFLDGETTPVSSPAAEDLAARAMAYTPEHPLYVICIGAITNVASALLLNPDIAERIVIVWLAGHAHDWPDCIEFNLFEDVAASRVVMTSGAALVQVPCMGVVSAFAVTPLELEHFLRGRNKLCDYLVEYTIGDTERTTRETLWSSPIWDVTAVAWLLGGFMEDRITKAPCPTYDGRYTFAEDGRCIRYVYHIHRDRLFRDLFEKLSRVEKP